MWEWSDQLLMAISIVNTQALFVRFLGCMTKNSDWVLNTRILMLILMVNKGICLSKSYQEVAKQRPEQWHKFKQDKYWRGNNFEQLSSCKFFCKPDIDILHWPRHIYTIIIHLLHRTNSRPKNQHHVFCKLLRSNHICKPSCTRSEPSQGILEFVWCLRWFLNSSRSSSLRFLLEFIILISSSWFLSTITSTFHSRSIIVPRSVTYTYCLSYKSHEWV